MVQYYISLYYVDIPLNPSILKDPEEQYKIIDTLNEEYKSDLAQRYATWRNEESENYFRHHIDYLTKVYTNREKEGSIRDRSAVLAEQVFAKMEQSRKIRMQNQ